MIETLVNKLQPEISHQHIPESSTTQNLIDDLSTDPESSDDDQETVNNTTTPMRMEKSLSLHLTPKPFTSNPTAVKDNDSLNPSSDNVDNLDFFGAHNNFSLFSTQGVRWIHTKVPFTKKDFEALVEGRKRIHSYFITTFKVWVEPIDTTQVVALPPQSDMNFAVDTFFKHMTGINFVFDKKDVQRMVNNYYDEEKKNTYAELLTMNLIIVIGIHYMMDLDIANNSNSESSTRFRKMFLKKFEPGEETAYVKNTIFYYHRLSVIGEGIRTVQAMILMVIVLTHISSPDIGYMIASTTIRLAQEMGLHRKESLNGLSPEEAKRRKLLWWTCYAVDVDISMKHGRPAIINLRDVSMPCEPISRDFLDQFNLLGSSLLNPLNDISEDSEDNYAEIVDKKISTFLPIFQEVIIRLMQSLNIIAGEFYEDLFSTNAFENKSFQDIVDKALLMESKIEAWKNALPVIIQPDLDQTQFWNDTNCSYFMMKTQSSDSILHYKVSKSLLLLVFFNYYYYQMALHRVVISFPDAASSELLSDGRNGRVFAKLSLQKFIKAAKSILELSRSYTSTLTVFANCLMFYPLSAFIAVFTHFLVHPQHPDASKNLEMMKLFINDFSDTKFNNNFGINMGSKIWDYAGKMLTHIFDLATRLSEKDKIMRSQNQRLQYNNNLPLTNNGNRISQSQPQSSFNGNSTVNNEAWNQSIPHSANTLSRSATHFPPPPFQPPTRTTSNIPLNFNGTNWPSSTSLSDLYDYNNNDLNSLVNDNNLINSNTPFLNDSMDNYMYSGMFSIPTFITDGVFDSPYLPNSEGTTTTPNSVGRPNSTTENMGVDLPTVVMDDYHS